VCRKLADNLLVKLWPFATGDGSLDYLEKVSQGLAHTTKECLLVLGERAVEFEGDKGDHCGWDCQEKGTKTDQDSECLTGQHCAVSG